MAQFTLHRAHALGLSGIQSHLQRWMEDGHHRFGLQSEQTATDEVLSIAFSRTGVGGQIHATATEVSLTVQLGFLLSPYRQRIEAVVAEQLDAAINASASPQSTSASPSR